MRSSYGVSASRAISARSPRPPIKLDGSQVDNEKWRTGR